MKLKLNINKYNKNSGLTQSMKAKKEISEAYFTQILNEIKPKARYISEMHMEEPIDSIYLQIINGDTDIATQKIPIENKNDKKGIEDMLRLKILMQAEKQKQMLEQKLSYLTNSINSLNRYDELNKRSPRSMRESYSMGGPRKEQWRQQIEERAKDIAKRKKIAEENKTKKQEELKQIEERMKQEEAEKKKKQILQHVKGIQERSKKRQQQVKVGNQRYKQLRKQKSLHNRLSESFNEKQLSFLQERKKKLAQIRNLHRPLDEMELKQHEQRFLESKKQKQQLREREKRMNQSRSNSYQPFYKSVFYQKALQDSKNEVENAEQAKLEKIKQYSQKIKEQFVPQIDERKRQQIQEFIEKEKRKIQEKQQKQRELREKAKQKGTQYLELVKSLPKKPRKTSADLTGPKTERIEYPNYLTHTQKKQAQRPWSKILSSSGDKQQKALQLQFQSKKHEQELKRKEQQVRLMKKGSSGQIDQQYFEMIKAKLDLLTTTK